MQLHELIRSRGRVAAAVVFVVLAVSWTGAEDVLLTSSQEVDVRIPDPIKKDTRRCKKEQDVCYVSCEDSTYNGFGVCREGKNGPETPMSIQCCCCTEGFENRYWIGG
jgi:hypothetical protein